MSDTKGKIQTVRGLINPDELGITLTHEHILFDSTDPINEPNSEKERKWRNQDLGASRRKVFNEPVSLDNIGLIYHHGWKNKDISRCYVDETLRYLINGKKNEIAYFENRIRDYINFLKSKEYIEKIILVTFPHKNHFGYNISKNKKNYYSINVSNIIDKVLKNEKKIYHLNFSKLIFDGKIELKNNEFSETDIASHLKEKYHANIFTQQIINLLK